MSFFTINLQDELGEIIDTLDDNGLLCSFLPAVEHKNYYCVKYIDQWGDTVFNRLQMDDLKNEIIKITEESQNKKVKDLVKNIVELIEKCKKEAHTYVKFVGD
jgi:hypothetical protein